MSLVEQVGKVSKIYIAEAGTENGWNYEKWVYPNGKKVWKGWRELSGTINLTGAASVGRSAAIPLPALPAGITNGKRWGTLTSVSSPSWGGVWGSDVNLFSSASATNVSYTFMVNAIGEWQ